jgi:hypothetical protein
MIYVLTNSVGLRCSKNYHHTFVDFIGGILPHYITGWQYHRYLYTALSALYDLKNLELNEDDIVICNFGVNDCIFRKDKRQAELINLIMQESIYRRDDVSSDFLFKKYKWFLRKRNDQITPLYSYTEFGIILDKILSQIKGRGIILSTCWFPEDHEKMGCYYNEVKKTNQILKAKTKAHNCVYVDLWNDHSIETIDDGVHLTPQGHLKVAMKIDKALEELNNRKV